MEAIELDRLAQGLPFHYVKGIDTIFFIHKHQFPTDRTVTYARTVYTFRPEKEDPNRTCVTNGGNLITAYLLGDTSTDAARLETLKMHRNSVLSTPNAKWMGNNISNMYFNTLLDHYKYM